MPFARKSTEKFTYSNYLTWPDEERWEISAGEAYNMTPAPGIKHQNVVVNFSSYLKQQLKGKSCRPFVAPTDVVLSEHDVVQPDIIVVCDGKKITEANIQGAPDLVVEVLSPSTALKDKREKKSLYERSCVGEYIIIDPLELYVERFVLEGKLYGGSEIFGPQEMLPLKSLEGIAVPLWEVFEVEEPSDSVKEDRPGKGR